MGDSLEFLVLAHNPIAQILFQLLSFKPCLRRVQLVIQVARTPAWL
jgi:hypothetical protein